MQNYIALLKDIMKNGTPRIKEEERTGAGCTSVFGRQLRWDISNKKMPIVTTRRIGASVFINEILFFISGNTNVRSLQEKGIKIWDKWAVTEESILSYFDKMVNKNFITPEAADFHAAGVMENSIGEIGKLYGFPWRFWPIDGENINGELMDAYGYEEIPAPIRAFIKQKYDEEVIRGAEGMDLVTFTKTWFHSTVDQLALLVMNIRRNPYSRRHIVTAYNPAWNPIDGFAPNEQPLMDRGALYPCHIGFQVFISPPKEEGGKKRLSLMWSQRSVDAPVGLGFNIAGYALLAHLLAKELDMETDELVATMGDVHIYANQFKGVEEQISREPLPQTATVEINDQDFSIFTVKAEDIRILNYESHPKIDYPINV